MITVLTAGDGFVLPELFQRAIRAALPGHPLTFRSIASPWPHEPFGDIEEVREASGSTSAVIQSLDGVDVAVTHHAPFTATVFESAAASSLRFVGVGRGGPVNVNLATATDAGVVVTFAPGRNAQAAAEYAVGMILAATRSIPTSSAALHGGTWRGDLYAYEAAGTELGGSTVGLVGYGAIGSIVARVLMAIGAHVLSADPYADPAQMIADGVEQVELDELMRRSQVVSLHARLTPETEKLIDERRLRLLPHGAVLVNTARGGLLDHGPLRSLVRSGAVSAVALDVYDEEPPGPAWPLLHEPRAVLTPHLAGASRQTAQRAADIVADDVRRFIGGDRPRFVANPDVFETAAYEERRRDRPRSPGTQLNTGEPTA